MRLLALLLSITASLFAAGSAAHCEELPVEEAAVPIYYVYVLDSNVDQQPNAVQERLKALGITVIDTVYQFEGGLPLAYYLIANCADIQSAMNIERLFRAADPEDQPVISRGGLNPAAKETAEMVTKRLAETDEPAPGTDTE